MRLDLLGIKPIRRIGARKKECLLITAYMKKMG